MLLTLHALQRQPDISVHIMIGCMHLNVCSSYNEKSEIKRKQKCRTCHRKLEWLPVSFATGRAAGWGGSAAWVRHLFPGCGQTFCGHTFPDRWEACTGRQKHRHGIIHSTYIIHRGLLELKRICRNGKHTDSWKRGKEGSKHCSQIE